MNKNQPVTIIYQNKKKKIGFLDDDVFHKYVDSRKHKLLVFPAYGIQLSVLEQLKELAVTEVIIHEMDTGIVFSSQVTDWEEHGRKMDLGHGEQMMLSINKMVKLS